MLELLMDGGAREKAVRAYFATARERFQVKEERDAGKDRPWTDDVIFQRFRFCNVHREDDKVTRWLRDNLRGPLAENARAVTFAVAAFRWFNLPATGERLKDMLLKGPSAWDSKKALELIGDLRPYSTGAYVIATPAGMTRAEGICYYLDQALSEPKHALVAFADSPPSTLEEACKVLQLIEGLGSFMAYEIVTDLRHTCVLRDASDILTWANVGPGSARGCGRVWRDDEEYFSRSNRADREQCVEIMRGLLELARTQRELWPSSWPQWEMREAEHWLCEWDKYERARLEQGVPKQRFDGEREWPERN